MQLAIVRTEVTVRNQRNCSAKQLLPTVTTPCCHLPACLQKPYRSTSSNISKYFCAIAGLSNFLSTTSTDQFQLLVSHYTDTHVYVFSLALPLYLNNKQQAPSFSCGVLQGCGSPTLDATSIAGDSTTSGCLANLKLISLKKDGR